MAVKGSLVFQLEDRQIDSWGRRNGQGGYLLARFLELKEDLTRVVHNVGIRQDPLAVNDHPRTRTLLRRCLGPGTTAVRPVSSREGLDHRSPDLELIRFPSPNLRRVHAQQ